MKASIVKVIKILTICLVAFLFSRVDVVAQESYLQLVERGLNAAQHDSLAEAEQFFLSAIRKEPSNKKNALIYTNLGKLQEKQGRIAEAVNSYSESIRIFPESVPLIKARADVFLKSNNYAKALLDYSKILEVSGMPPVTEGKWPLSDVYVCMGHCCTKLHQNETAEQYFNIVLEKEPDNYLARLGLVVLKQSTGNVVDALNRLNLLMDKYPDKAELYSMRAELEVDSKSYELAEQDLTRAINLDSNNSNYVLARADVYMQINQKSKALDDFKQAIKLGVPRSAINEKMKKCK